MSETNTNALKDDIEALKAVQQRLYALGWGDEKYQALIMTTTLIAIGVGVCGIINVLYSGLGWISAASIFIGSVALYKGFESDRNKASCREQYQQNRSRLADMEDRYRELTLIPESSEESERKWKQMISGLDP